MLSVGWFLVIGGMYRKWLLRLADNFTGVQDLLLFVQVVVKSVNSRYQK